ncbi:MAG: GNAT family N-acetyltransferase, partial [Pseudomonadota bacterium]
EWWARAMVRKVPVVVLDAGGAVRGYVTYGASRMRTLPFRAEIYELYIQPEYTGGGFGRRLFRTVQQRLARRGHTSFVVWCLADNADGCAFYERLGGKVVASALEPFESVEVEKVAYAFTAATNPRVRLAR